MGITAILREKREQLLKTGNPLSVAFTAEEVNALSDINALRCMSLLIPFPEEFTTAENLFDCTKRIVDGDGPYRVLEFCLLKNRALKNSIPVVFSIWRKSNGRG